MLSWLQTGLMLQIGIRTTGIDAPAILFLFNAFLYDPYPSLRTNFFNESLCRNHASHVTTTTVWYISILHFPPRLPLFGSYGRSTCRSLVHMALFNLMLPMQLLYHGGDLSSRLHVVRAVASSNHATLPQLPCSAFQNQAVKCQLCGCYLLDDNFYHTTHFSRLQCTPIPHT